MSFLPIGPDFVFAPRNPNFKRLSLRNEQGYQGLVSHIALNPQDANVIYVVVRPSTGGANLFRTNDGGATWIPLFDKLLQTNQAQAQVATIAINFLHPEIIYAATSSGHVFISSDQGDNWNPPNFVANAGDIRQLIVDPRTTANTATTVLLAAGRGGVFRSVNGGVTWARVLQGNVTSIAASFPTNGSDDYYASVFQKGLFYTSDPTTVWTNLNTANVGLPARDNKNNAYDVFAVDICRTSKRVYACMAKSNKTLGLYTSASPTTQWTSVKSSSLPDAHQGLYTFGLAIAPNSPGDGVNDILFFTTWHLHRSTDAGKTWTILAGTNNFHDDLHCVAFAPDPTPAGLIPGTYVGCDGGVGFSDKYADPSFDFGSEIKDFNEGVNYSDSGIIQNLNHGLANSAIIAYDSHPSLPALSYVACQDTGVAGGKGSLGWRGLQGADGYNVSVFPGADGIKVWNYYAVPNKVGLITDRGGFGNSSVDCKLNGEVFWCSTNTVIGLDGKLVCGIGVHDDRGNSLNDAVLMAGTLEVAPSSMKDISVGVFLAVDDGTANNAEIVMVTTVTGTTFTANFTMPHKAGASVHLQRTPVVRIDQNGIATQISQNFFPTAPKIVAASPVDPNVLYCATDDERLWTTSVGATAGPDTLWTEVTESKPSPIGAASVDMMSIAFDNAGNPYVLCSDVSSWAGGGENAPTITPLFLITNGLWIGQTCLSLPSAGFGKLVADPVQSGTMYAIRGNRIFKLSNSPMGWQWTDIGDGLPGAPLYDLWIAKIGKNTAPKVILRTAATTRGIYEANVTANAIVPATFLYVRANFLDSPLLDTCPAGVPNPFDPKNASATIYHYASPDIKIDVQTPQGFFQNDPEGPLPLSHVLFDQMLDNSQALPQTIAARVHVQVHNYAPVPANNIWVWAIYCNASAGLPALSASRSKNNRFPFWSQFLVNGKIANALPADSPWKEIGPPQKLNGIAASTPQVASWGWIVPKLSNHDPGHYCIALFIHSAASPLNDASMDVDDLARRKRQVGQKNLHVGPALVPSGSSASGGSGSGTGSSGAAGGTQEMREYVEFNNPTVEMRRVDLVFDFRGLPPQLKVSFRLSKLNTIQPLPNSIIGATRRTGSAAPSVPPISGPGIQMTIPLDKAIYDALSSVLVRISGVGQRPFDTYAAEISVRYTGSLPAGSEYWFHVQQWVGNRLLGGSQYQVKIAGIPKRKRTHIEEEDSDLAPIRNHPLWARKIIAHEMKRQFKDR